MVWFRSTSPYWISYGHVTGRHREAYSDFPHIFSIYISSIHPEGVIIIEVELARFTKFFLQITLIILFVQIDGLLCSYCIFEQVSQSELDLPNEVIGLE